MKFSDLITIIIYFTFCHISSQILFFLMLSSFLWGHQQSWHPNISISEIEAGFNESPCRYFLKPKSRSNHSNSDQFNSRPIQFKPKRSDSCKSDALNFISSIRHEGLENPFLGRLIINDDLLRENVHIQTILPGSAIRVIRLTFFIYTIVVQSQRVVLRVISEVEGRICAFHGFWRLAVVFDEQGIGPCRPVGDPVIVAASQGAAPARVHGGAESPISGSSEFSLRPRAYHEPVSELGAHDVV